MARSLLLPSLAVAALLVAAPVCRAEENGQKVYDQTLRSTVLILSPADKPREQRGGQGSGSLISLDDKLVLTNYHVVGDRKETWVFFPIVENGKIVAERQRYAEQMRKNPAMAYRGRVVARDPKADLALVQLDRLPPDAVALKLAKESARPGERVHSVGNPGVSDALWLYTSGTVRQVYQKRWEVRDQTQVYHHDARILETQSPTNPGDSGGPLVNDQGELVGVTQGLTAQALLLSLFIDVSEVRGLLAAKNYRYAIGDRPLAAAPSTPLVSETNAVESPAKDPALLRLQQALNHLQAGRNADAREAFKEIIDKHPTSPYVNEAKALLETIKKK